VRAPRYYRIPGSSLLVEYDNSQDRGDRGRSAWRDPQADLGCDLLRRHYAIGAHP
jgi:hypothetical protein